ncbi:MAG: thiamine phosphate synthase [Nitrospirae bacterium]|nr:thiamine phosphate synthase [Nitrospirota bacterium]
MPSICLIVGSQNEELVRSLLEKGFKWVQYREKERTKREMFYQAFRLREMTAKANALFIVNDHVDIALAVDADGVHLGQDDLPIIEARGIMGGKIIGISTHSAQEAIDAERGGADYIGFGSIFPTSTKDNAVVQGLESLRFIKERVKIPVIAIGGIKADNVKSVFCAGADGVAVSSGIMEGDAISNAERFIAAMMRLC